MITLHHKQVGCGIHTPDFGRPDIRFCYDHGYCTKNCEYHIQHLKWQLEGTHGLIDARWHFSC